MQNGKSLPPYLRGGTPGALIVFKFGEAIMSILGGIIMVISLFHLPSDGSSVFSSLLSLGASGFGMVLVILEGISALKLRKGSDWDAAKIRTIWSIRRVATIVIMIILGISCTIIMFSRGGFLMGFIMLALYEGFMCFMLCYTNDVRTNMSIVCGELYSGKPTFYLPDNRLSGLAIFFGVLMGAFALAMGFALNGYHSYSYSFDIIYEYGMLIPFVFFLTAAHFFLVAGCNRAFKRAHATQVDATDFAPTGMNRATTLGIIGAILFSWMALVELFDLIRAFNYRYYSAADIVNMTVYLSVYVLFAVALLVSRARDLLASIGAGLILILYSFFLITGRTKPTSIWNIGYVVTYLSGIALLLVMAVLGLARRPVPFAMRIVAIALFAYIPLYAILNTIIYRYFSLFTLSNILTSTVPITVGFIALSLAIGRPAMTAEEQNPSGMPDGDGAPLSVG